MRGWLRLLFTAGFSFLLVGWHHVLSEEAFFSVDRGADYSRVARNPDVYRGSVLMLAGEIAENLSTADRTLLEIICFKRDDRDAPEAPDEKCGRFFARSAQLLDPEQYRTGRRVTLTGIVTGEKGPSGTFQLFDIGEIHLWPVPAERPPLYYTPHPYHPGPYFDPWCDPFYPWPYRDHFHYPYSCW